MDQYASPKQRWMIASLIIENGLGDRLILQQRSFNKTKDIHEALVFLPRYAASPIIQNLQNHNNESALEQIAAFDKELISLV